MSKVIDEVVFKKSIEDMLQYLSDNCLYEFVPYDDTEISNLFSLTPEEAQKLSDLISDEVVSKYKLWSSSKVNESLISAKSECNDYTDKMLTNISSISIKYVDTLPTSDISTSTIYILKNTGGGNDTLNLYDGGSWTSIGEFTISLEDFYKKDVMDTKLNEKANKTEVLLQNDVIVNKALATNSNVLTAKAVVDELDLKVNDTDFDTHTGDTDIHITSAERTEWNKKQYKVFNYDEITSKNTINTLTDLIKLVPSGETWYIHALSIPSNINLIDFGFPSGMNRWGTIIISKRGNGLTHYNIELFTNEDYLVTHKWIGCGSGVDYTNGSVIVPAYTTRWQEIAIGFTKNISINSKNSQTPTAKAAFEATIGVVPTDEILQSANNSVLKFPVGNWLIYSTSFAQTLNDLPIQEGGRLQVLSNSVSPNTPWTTPYWVRMYRYSSYAKGEWIRYLNSGDTPGVIANDSGWQKVCTTSVVDVSRTELDIPTLTEGKFENAFSGNISNYSVKNGVCTLTLTVKCVTPISNLDTVIGSKILPKSANGIVYAFGFDRNMSTSTNPIMIQVDAYGNLFFGGGTTGGNYRLTFSYPVAE